MSYRSRWLCVHATSWRHHIVHATQAGDAAQEVEPEALGPEADQSTATARACEAARACLLLPDAPNGPSALGLGGPGGVAGVSMLALDGAAGLGSGSAESALHTLPAPEPAEREPEPAQAERTQAQAERIQAQAGDTHAAPGLLPAVAQAAASSLVRVRCIQQCGYPPPTCQTYDVCDCAAG